MTSISNETLKEIRDRLNTCLGLMHDETEASAKEELIRTIATIDSFLESDNQENSSKMVIRMIGKIVEKLPWIALLLKNLE